MRLLRRDARRRYGLDDIDHSSPSRLREVAHAITERRLAAGSDAGVVHAGELAALLLLQDLVTSLVDDYLRLEHPDAMERTLKALDDELGTEDVDELLQEIVDEFAIAPQPSRKAAADSLSPQERRVALEALVAIWQLNRNPALEQVRELFDDRDLAPSVYAAATEVLESSLRPSTHGQRAPEKDLLERLAEPTKASPDSVAGQLHFVLDEWRHRPALSRRRLLRTLDALEEETLRPPPGPGPIELPAARDLRPPSPQEAPRQEAAWMSELALVAKHCHVWLDQLARARGRPVNRLDQVPDRELARLAQLGVTGLWLIGVWQRSEASRLIKRLTGSRDGESSAYSVFDYRVSADLGGETALEELQNRALQHGIRLGVDVVPNHFGIDSRWLRDHPDRFLASDGCPYPSYSFTGHDLSSHPDIGIYLEDHYYDQTDAAVVFRRLDRRSGEERFIYHGNDGTSTPWNDTAQLDYTREDVREAMTETIVDLAKRFRILRFDAAMTLTRLHFQRLWFPAPGSGGAVPSRSDFGMSEEDFADLMPTEFWRQVVERVAVEAPDTLLIAEAFWLMEPFFVTELGMDRVYNSAFMHMLREGENEMFQRLLRNTADRAPELLKRSVNFLTTPDEASAAEQFGRGDRYFGACALLATMPGTPLFGHGQIEGLGEKYGMEFRRARSDELPHETLIERHSREIAPLLAERGRFASVDELQLLDFIGSDGAHWNEVFAWSTGRGRNARIVLFNNSDRTVQGFVRAPQETELAILPEAGSAGKDFLLLHDSRFDLEIESSVSRLRSAGLEVTLSPWQALVLQAAS